MKPRTLNILLALLSIVFMFIFSFILVSLYLMFYEWMKESGFSFWQFVFIMAGTATLLSLPKILDICTKCEYLDKEGQQHFCHYLKFSAKENQSKN